MRLQRKHWNALINPSSRSQQHLAYSLLILCTLEKYDTTEIGFQNFAVTFAPVVDLYFNKNSKANYAEDLKTEQPYKEFSNTN